MPFVPSILAFADIEAFLTKALESPKGTKLSFTTPNEATRFVARAHHYRKLARQQNKILYPEPGNSMHGACIFDVLMIKKKKDSTEVTIEKVDISMIEETEL